MDPRSIAGPSMMARPIDVILRCITMSMHLAIPHVPPPLHGEG